MKVKTIKIKNMKRFFITTHLTFDPSFTLHLNKVKAEQQVSDTEGKQLKTGTVLERKDLLQDQEVDHISLFKETCRDVFQLLIREPRWRIFKNSLFYQWRRRPERKKRNSQQWRQRPLALISKHVSTHSTAFGNPLQSAAYVCVLPWTGSVRQGVPGRWCCWWQVFSTIWTHTHTHITSDDITPTYILFLTAINDNRQEQDDKHHNPDSFQYPKTKTWTPSGSVWGWRLHLLKSVDAYLELKWRKKVRGAAGYFQSFLISLTHSRPPALIRLVWFELIRGQHPV